jgi:hypothetical protein
MASIRVRIDRVKADPSRLVDRRVVERACIEAGHRWRDRVLDPATTLRVFAMQIANANTAISHTIRLAGGGFTESAYCQARSRLPVPVVRAVFDASVGATRREGRWCGRRVAIVDGSGVSVPDTPELRAFFGTAGGCAEGCGLPLMSVLAVFDADDGRLLDVHAAPRAATFADRVSGDIAARVERIFALRGDGS